MAEENTPFDDELKQESAIEDETSNNGKSEAADNAYTELLDRYQRTLAEFDNFRKRTLKEKAGAYDNGVNDAIEKLLPTLDNFERALASSENKDDKFYKGIEMIARQLESYLTDLGVETIKVNGENFDHNLHFAVAHVEDPQYGTGEIIEQLQKGYTYKGKVMRPSMVKVAN
ncbi:MAG: nucleotide exchange factor GrpE [Defluviitaleaceae bacterium]|nr:nucleotide exchange factor GrpE [Defluviitaleaceae bacterium]